MKVIFCDIDGPLISGRAVFLPGNRGKLVSWFDPVATALLLDVIEETQCKLVISSTWRHKGKDVCFELLTKNGVSTEFLHEDWRTPVHFSECDRSLEIKEWLTKHKPEKYAILDDGWVDLPNFVRTTELTGLELHHWEKLINILK